MLFRSVTVGQTVVKPSPIFVKLDPAVAEQELERLEAEASDEA